MLLRTLVVVLCAAVAACSKPKPVWAPQPPVTRADGLVTQVLAAGPGDAAKRGDKITVHFVGTLADAGVFDSSRARNAPFSFWVGERQVIEGLDDGLLGMREGETRRITVPPALGYGSDEKPGIPCGSTLSFEVELLDVR